MQRRAFGKPKDFAVSLGKENENLVEQLANIELGRSRRNGRRWAIQQILLDFLVCQDLMRQIEWDQRCLRGKLGIGEDRFCSFWVTLRYQSDFLLTTSIVVERT